MWVAEVTRLAVTLHDYVDASKYTDDKNVPVVGSAGRNGGTLAGFDGFEGTFILDSEHMPDQ